MKIETWKNLFNQNFQSRDTVVSYDMQITDMSYRGSEVKIDQLSIICELLSSNKYYQKYISDTLEMYA